MFLWCEGVIEHGAGVVLSAKHELWRTNESELKSETPNTAVGDLFHDPSPSYKEAILLRAVSLSELHTCLWGVLR